MQCPICGGRALVARTNIPQLVDQVQEGVDPYDLIYEELDTAECLTCGHTFKSGAATGNPAKPVDGVSQTEK